MQNDGSSGRHRGGSGNFANDPGRASAAGRKGGRNSGGNFAKDPARASAAGRKGGQASSGNFAHDRARASAAGRKGGQANGAQGSDLAAGSREAPHRIGVKIASSRSGVAGMRSSRG